jgi:hypothetical protein
MLWVFDGGSDDGLESEVEERGDVEEEDEDEAMVVERDGNEESAAEETRKWDGRPWWVAVDVLFPDKGLLGWAFAVVGGGLVNCRREGGTGERQ